jgi:hypothetical protein
MLGVVVHVYNPRYLEGRVKKMKSSRPAQSKGNKNKIKIQMS